MIDFSPELLAGLRQRLGSGPWEAALLLGSGLGDLAEQLEQSCSVDYRDIPGFPLPSAAGHRGRLVAGRLAGWPLLLFQGRFHTYEGHSAETAACTVQLAAALGCRRILLTNAAGGIRPGFRPGDFMWVEDHLNLSGANPLRGCLDRPFLDLTRLYRAELHEPLQSRLSASGVTLHRGVLCMLAGPSYETPAEIRMLSHLGADAVSMSTVTEAILARWYGLQVAALSLIANPAAGLGAAVLDHRDVLAAGRQAVSHLAELVAVLLPLWTDATMTPDEDVTF